MVVTGLSDRQSGQGSSSDQPCCRNPDFTSLWGANQLPHLIEVNNGEIRRFCLRQSVPKPLTIYQKRRPNHIQPTSRGEERPVATASNICQRVGAEATGSVDRRS
jgi:hypothetical protein